MKGMGMWKLLAMDYKRSKQKQQAYARSSLILLQKVLTQANRGKTPYHMIIENIVKQ